MRRQAPTTTCAATALALLWACSACSVRREADLSDLLVSTVAHELGHSAGLTHTDDGVMQSYNDPFGHDALMPAPTDWHETGVRDCIRWSVTPALARAFAKASDAWCDASSGEFCPELFDDSTCQARFDDLGSEYLGYWSKHLIRISDLLEPWG
jgi:hypothetical protein